MTWHCKETIRSIYDIDDCDLAAEFVDQLTQDLRDDSMPLEVRSFGRTIARWRDQIVAWHRARVSNGPTEAVVRGLFGKCRQETPKIGEHDRAAGVSTAALITRSNAEVLA